MFIVKLYIFSTLITLNYAYFFGDLFNKEPEETHESHLLEKLQEILIQSSETYQKAKQKIETASGFAKQLPELLHYPQQLLNDAWSKFRHLFDTPTEMIKQFEDSLKIAKDLAEIANETLEKLFEILIKTEEITMILQEISLKDIEHVTDEDSEASRAPCGTEKGTEAVPIEATEVVTEEVSEGITEEVTKDLTEEVTEEDTEGPLPESFQDKEIVIKNEELTEKITKSTLIPTSIPMETTTKGQIVIPGYSAISDHKPHHSHKPHHKPLDLCNCEVCSCEKSCRPSKGEAVQYIPCQVGTVCCIKKPRTGPYSTMAWETVLQLAMDHLHNTLDNME